MKAKSYKQQRTNPQNFFELKNYLHLLFSGLDDYSENEEILFITKALNMKKERLLLKPELSKQQIKRVLRLAKKRICGEPTNKIFKSANFYYDEFFINKNVLAPRKETEIVVEKALNYIESSKKTRLRVLDLCCGSGIIGLIIAKYSKKDVFVYLSDISKKALCVAKKNQLKLGCKKNTEIICSNMFSNLKKGFLFDIIISNPPYIKTKEIKELSKGVKKFDPKIALDGGESGLKFYSIIAQEAKKFLCQDGKVFLEIGYNQKDDITKIFKDNGFCVECFKDYSNNDRIIVANQK